MHFTVRYGQGNKAFHLQEGKEADLICYDANPGLRTEEDIIRQALLQPIKSPLLKEVAKGKKKAAILISDISRLSPSEKFLPFLIDELKQGGLREQQIKIIVSLGMHRKQTRAELEQLVGPTVFRSIEVLNHSPLPDDCVHVGTTRQGTEVEILREVVEADLRLATGNMEPHGLAGLSGGAKALMPGVASQRSIEMNHSLSGSHKISPGNPDNPIRRDMEEVLQMVPVHFLFNAVVNHRKEMIEAISGDPIFAHRQLAEKAKARFLVRAEQKYDAVIVSAGGFPKDMQLYQAVKTLQNAAKITKPGGKILLIARCQEMFGNGMFQYWVETVQDHARIDQMMKEQFVLGAHKVSHIHKILEKHQVYFYSDMPAPLVELIGFYPVQDLQSCVNELSLQGSLAVMPYGSLTFPHD